MELLEGANYFAVLVGLICNWKAERGAKQADKFDDFLNYLAIHHFETLRTEILESRDLQGQLKNLLSEDMASISGKLDVISQGIASLAGKLEGIAPLAQTLAESAEGLSKQAAEILKVFEQTESEEMMWLLFNEGSFMFLPSQMGVGFSEKRFIRSDLESLLNFGFLQMGDKNDSDTKSFLLTRLGARYASKLPKVNIGGSE